MTEEASAGIRWITAFLDVPEVDFEVAAAFWTGVTDTVQSSARGDRGQFLTLVPAAGDPHLRMQRIGAQPRVHVDLHVDSIAAARDHAVRLGATVVEEPAHVIMCSPAGLVFCLVGAGDGATVAPPIGTPSPHRVDQLCVDVPYDRFEDEAAFWAALAGWPVEGSSRFPEFARLRGSERMPLCFLLQRLGPDDPRRSADVHLDISSGPSRRGVVERHRSLGAEVVADFERWTVMRDPAGLTYCVTSRPPERPDDPR